MSTSTEALHAGRSRVEKATMDALAERMATQFPELPADEITRVIRGRYEGSDDGPVRDVAPVRDEQRVRAEPQRAPRHRA